MQQCGTAMSSLVRDVLVHLERADRVRPRLLGSILNQGNAIRERDVEGVLARLGDIKTEMTCVPGSSRERTDLLGALRRAARRAGREP